MNARTLVAGAALTWMLAEGFRLVMPGPRRMRLAGKTVLVCGASRGLGRAIALELARRKCRIAICARSESDLEKVRAELVRLGATVYAQACDLRELVQVEDLVANVTAHLGPIDVTIASAATIQVGPLESLKASDFEEAMSSIFKTSLHAALATLPGMRERRAGTLAFITSVGGKIAVPHLVPYSSAKFAEVGLAEGIRAETAKDGVHVLTVVPGLMRTGGHFHGNFKGDSEKEYAWFGTGATAPGPLTISAARAARRIARALERGDAQIVLTPAAKLAVRANGYAPSLVRFALKLAGRLLPRAPKRPSFGARAREGAELEASSPSKAIAYVHARGIDLLEKNNQLA